VAVATPPGAGALGIVRLSGPDALAIAGAVLPSPPTLATQPTHTLRRVALRDPSTHLPLDDALCAVMRAPATYTGEDVVELSCHGSPALLAMLVERLRVAGARLAEPGEFTRRAYLNGRMDLARAEAVALLIGARTERAVAAAARALAGEVGARVGRLRDELLALIAGLEVTLDFPDDEVGLAVETAREAVATLADDVAGIHAAACRGRLVHEGVTVALVGRPNAGKSSLLNALVGRDRAIVAPTPGTTRDVVEGALVLDGVLVRVLDTAGLGAAHDAIEAEGMQRTVRAIHESDVIVLVTDGSAPPGGEVDLSPAVGRPIVRVWAKSDLPRHPEAEGRAGALAVSATTGAGIAALTRALAAEVTRLIGDDGDDGHLAATLRQRARLEALEHDLRRATEALAAMPLDVALVDLHAALAEVSSLLGVEVGDDVLDRIFATFCVGK